ncbi:nitrilase-related carbon-nitrogen hydrolase [Planifilum fimeticola]
MVFKAAMIQMRAVPGEVVANRKSALNLVEKAAHAGARLAVLPELWSTGYHLSPQQFRELAETCRGETVSLFQRIAAERKMVLVVPFAEEEGEKIYNSAAVIDSSGKLVGLYRKTFLWGREKRIFSPGLRSYSVFDTSLGKIGVLICYDAEFPEPARLLGLGGADLIAVPSVWSKEAESRWDIQLPARALDNTVFVLGTNTTGEGSCGKSKLVAPDGRVQAAASGEGEEVLIGEVDLSLISRVRQRIPYWDDYDPSLTPGGLFRAGREYRKG